jgi:hypothetical protein
MKSPPAGATDRFIINNNHGKKHSLSTIPEISVLARSGKRPQEKSGLIQFD